MEKQVTLQVTSIRRTAININTNNVTMMIKLIVVAIKLPDPKSNKQSNLNYKHKQQLKQKLVQVIPTNSLPWSVGNITTKAKVELI